MPDRLKLPIGIQTFKKVRKDGYYYVDKTSFIKNLVDEGEHFFLSRPRRFGKSLFVDTMKELFEGNEALFEGLMVHDQWDWSVKNPVVRLDFSGGNFTRQDSLPTNVEFQLLHEEQRFGISGSEDSTVERFGALLKNLHEHTGQRVVVLIDEYDHPILSSLRKPELAREHRDYLQGLYGMIKYAEAHIRLCFLTGVSKFSKVSLFSGLNNLRDITLTPKYSTICGYTEKDLENVFSLELEGLDRDTMREWYNGYSWRGDTKVYNPFDILLLFAEREFGRYWFETGTPTFLVETLLRRRISSVNLDGLKAGSNLLSSFDVDAIAPEALLFQTGYLTIQAEEFVAGKNYFQLGYPNLEVRQSLNEALLDHMVGNLSGSNTYSKPLYDKLAADQMDATKDVLHAFFASIPYEWYTNNDISRFEGYYASVFYSLLTGIGLKLSVEDSSNKGRLDLSFSLEDRVYIFEFKVVEQSGEGTALAQLKSRSYADKYRTPSTLVTLIGVEFSAEERNIVSFEVERSA
ncbi:MAG: AAA family ATPase [Gammaproteobacteria bacterium]|nr:AAA family ATPase [Gammaproteobacteria bacterium]